ncbi:hypothetical protein RJ55_05442 [Drechmeria coniospora]|nr:hypothetical protein RJ55_05442 [Drechmeria coniospora]
MKFAKELEHDAVPEWRIKYLNYKLGKKHVKAVSRAINRTPRAVVKGTPSQLRPRSADVPPSKSTPIPGRAPPPSVQPAPIPALHVTGSERDDERAGEDDEAEHDLLTGSGKDVQYGSFVPTPFSQSPETQADGEHEFELPAPALRVPSNPTDASQRNVGIFGPKNRRSSLTAVNATSAVSHTAELTRSRTVPRKQTVGARSESSSQLRRILSRATDGGASHSDLVRERERDFYDFMDAELEKVEAFYRLKEEQAGQRLVVLREQLHEMRNRRIQEMTDKHDARKNRNGTAAENGHDKANGWVRPIKAKIFPPGPNSRALRSMPQTPRLAARASAETNMRDYSRRPADDEVSYRTAKRKLKLALQEFYRSLELLKSYALLNRTAFRKINKKFDKAANARPPLRYMNEKVNKAWFVNSDVLDGHLKAVEDLYGRYFERGNHKLAVGKLRAMARKSTDESGSSFVNGFLIGTGVVLSIQGLVCASRLLLDDDAQIRQDTSFLLQIYAGYFLMLLLFSLFCIDCFVWTRNKVNYPFIFEFDMRSHIDWRRLAQFPSFFLFLFGLFFWINFSRFGAGWMYLYYPVVLIAITLGIIFLPAPVLVHKSRQWFVYAHWRLLLAGIYPVEFRDFFLGDMYCSLTYCMANIELFFCLYANRWDDPAKCNSNHSRLLGFLTTLPPIWRFLQCLRRYRDTANVFPHLVNGGKYTMTIVSFMMLSLYRIDGSTTNLALYITSSLITSIYVSIWDLFMDFSLLQAHSRHALLRDILALKRRWPYYAIMVVDPLLRFAWIFYAIFTHNAQHSTTISFVVALLEISRRGMWALFRVENEHCANVAQYKASREVPLPYLIEPLMDRASTDDGPVMVGHDDAELGVSAPAGPVASTASTTTVARPSEGLRRRAEASTTRTFSKILAEAHRQDFQKRRKAADQNVVDEEAVDNDQSDDDDDDDDDENDDDDDDEEEAASLME